MVIRIAIGLFAASLLSALLARFLGNEALAEYLGAPALIMSGWAALGHLVTVDDDTPGEWSNPESETAIWRHSLVELAVKIIAFALVGIAVYA